MAVGATKVSNMIGMLLLTTTSYLPATANNSQLVRLQSNICNKSSVVKEFATIFCYNYYEIKSLARPPLPPSHREMFKVQNPHLKV